LDF
jgi:hypothetical protein